MREKKREEGPCPPLSSPCRHLPLYLPNGFETHKRFFKRRKRGREKRKLRVVGGLPLRDLLKRFRFAPQIVIVVDGSDSVRRRRRGANPDPNPSRICYRGILVGSCQAGNLTPLTQKQNFSSFQLTTKLSVMLVKVSENGRGVRNGAEILQLPLAISSPSVPSDSLSLCV